MRNEGLFQGATQTILQDGLNPGQPASETRFRPEERGPLTWHPVIPVPLSLNVQLHRRIKPVAHVLLIGLVRLPYHGGCMANLRIDFLFVCTESGLDDLHLKQKAHRRMIGLGADKDSHTYS